MEKPRLFPNISVLLPAVPLSLRSSNGSATIRDIATPQNYQLQTSSNMKLATRKRCGFALSYLLLCTLMLFTSCSKNGEKLTASQIDEKYGKSVALVQVQYCYSISLGENLTWYFTGIDEEGELENFATSEEEAVAALGYGTGFFISDDGKIATNCHVAAPSLDEQAVKEKCNADKGTIVSVLHQEINADNDTIHLIQNMWAQVPSGSEEEAQLEVMLQHYTEERDRMQAIADNISSIDFNNAEITLNCQVGVAYNNTFITKETDFKECVLTAKDEEHDVAIIQLKEKKTPENCAVVDIKKHDPESEEAPVDENGDPIDTDKMPLGAKLYLIGYNLGPGLALTKDGVKAQVTDGKISQDTDDTQMMYTIPALHGSSGSPVFDEYGNFVAINYAGIDTTQSFNYGIKAKHLRKLLE